MYGLKTIHQLNREAEEAERIMAKHEQLVESQDATRLSAAKRSEIAKETMKRILNGARG